jgi:hypothetical protein
MIIIGEVESGK